MADYLLYHHPRHALLGDQTMQILDPLPGPPGTWTGEQDPPPLPDPPMTIGRTPHDELLARVDLLIAEVAALRADLASRTLAARLRRGWRWLLDLLP